jgi:hypothetical protein
MEQMQNGRPGPHESWRELAEHSLTHDNLPPGRGEEIIVMTHGQPPGGDVLVIVPSRERPGRLALMITETLRTSRARTAIAVCCDDDDPARGAYESLQALHGPDPRVRWHYGPRQTLAGWTNQIAASPPAREFTAVASLGDDHLPQTDGWDEILLAALTAQGGGLAYGDDLHQGSALPTAPLIATAAVTALGWMCLPGCEHYCIDDAWLALFGAAGLLAYRGDVVIEHVHPDAGKAPADRTYADAVRQYWGADRAAFLAWRYSGAYTADVDHVQASARHPVPVR